jgi:hypothetical protein
MDDYISNSLLIKYGVPASSTQSSTFHHIFSDFPKLIRGKIVICAYLSFMNVGINKKIAMSRILR